MKPFLALTPRGTSVVTNVQVHVESGKQETSFGGARKRTFLDLKIEFLKERVKGLYQKLSESKDLVRTSEAFHFDKFRIRDGKLYYGKMNESLTKKSGELRQTSALKRLLGEENLRYLGFEYRVTPEQAAMLNKAKKEMLSASDIANADGTELQDMTKTAFRIVEDLTMNMQTQTDESIKNSLCELLGFDKELKRIRGQLNVAVAKKL